MVNKIISKFKHGTVMLYLHDRLMGIGLEFSPFYLTREPIGNVDLTQIQPDLPDWEFKELDLEDIKLISKIPDQGRSLDDLVGLFKKGRKCYSIRVREEIVSFTWISLDESDARYYKFKLLNNECYLFHLFTDKKYRGKKLARILRVLALNEMKKFSKDTAYSVTDAANNPSMKLKKSIGDKKVFFGIYIELFRKFKKTFVIKYYDQNFKKAHAK